MTETVEVPKVGPVDKKVVAAIVVGTAGFVGYRYWQTSRNAPATDDTSTTVASEFDDSGDPSTVLGAIKSGNAYGSGDPVADATADDFGFHGVTNAQWTQYVAAKLSQSDRWDYGEILEALGKYLSQSPTTSTQQAIITSAVAVAGNPPVGSFTLVHAPTPIEPVTPVVAAPVVATPGTPSGVTLTNNTAANFTVSWNPVPGAMSYVVDTHNGVTHPTNGTTFTAVDFRHKTKYTVTVRAVNSAGSSANSAAVTFTSK